LDRRATGRRLCLRRSNGIHGVFPQLRANRHRRLRTSTIHRTAIPWRTIRWLCSVRPCCSSQSGALPLLAEHIQVRAIPLALSTRAPAAMNEPSDDHDGSHHDGKQRKHRAVEKALARRSSQQSRLAASRLFINHSLGERPLCARSGQSKTTIWQRLALYFRCVPEGDGEPLCSLIRRH
jgi:hypothetical protein